MIIWECSHFPQTLRVNSERGKASLFDCCLALLVYGKKDKPTTTENPQSGIGCSINHAHILKRRDTAYLHWPSICCWLAPRWYMDGLIVVFLWGDAFCSLLWQTERNGESMRAETNGEVMTAKSISHLTAFRRGEWRRASWSVHQPAWFSLQWQHHNSC